MEYEILSIQKFKFIQLTYKILLFFHQKNIIIQGTLFLPHVRGSMEDKLYIGGVPAALQRSQPMFFPYASLYHKIKYSPVNSFRWLFCGANHRY
jgi:hypothetical protein